MMSGGSLPIAERMLRAASLAPLCVRWGPGDLDAKPRLSLQLLLWSTRRSQDISAIAGVLCDQTAENLGQLS